MEIDGEHVTAHPAAEQLERAHDHRIVLGGMIHRQRPARSVRRGDHLVALGDRRRHRLFHEDVAAHLERFDREPGVRRRRRQDVDDVGTHAAHSERLANAPGMAKRSASACARSTAVSAMPTMRT